MKDYIDFIQDNKRKLFEGNNPYIERDKKVIVDIKIDKIFQVQF